MNQIASHFRRLGDADPAEKRVPLGQMLLNEGDLSVGELLPALSAHKSLDVPLGQVLVAEGGLEQARLYDHLSQQWDIARADLTGGVDPLIARKVGLPYCLRHKAIPLEIRNGVLLLAVSGMEAFSNAERELEETFGLITPVIATPREIETTLRLIFPSELAEMAATDVPFDLSCRGLAENSGRRIAIGSAILTLLGLLLLAFPIASLIALTAISIGLSLGSALLKCAALVANLTSKKDASPPPLPAELPQISIMVPLHKEPDITRALIERLGRLTYPKPLLQVLLVIEENDTITRDAIDERALPPWMSPIIVPEGQPKTKPRALNHAFKFCTGDIIGIYDAEDAPDTDQLEKVAAKFAASAPDVACLQGILQFYNPTQNWLARCFAMDYAAWFRVILPGLARLGMPVPLGGTTLFLRREAIEAMHGWDAHNVTEDADLGLRLNRAGYRTELIDTVTGEEANCHSWKWVRQRSRWIKGYMVTYYTHMRQPLRLWRELGTTGFVGFQVLFLGTNLHFMTAPLLWSFWLSYIGVQHAFFAHVPVVLTTVTALAFLGVELLTMTILAIACRRAKRGFLIPWIPTMSFYFLLAVPAGLKALWEFFKSPVYWDKTDHGHSLGAD